jgi:hypothetical protein
MVKPLVVALVAAISTGCAAVPSGPNPVSAAGSLQDTCDKLSEFSHVAREMRADGLSEDQAKSVIALAALREGVGADTRSERATGGAMFRTVNHVYSKPLMTPSQTQRSTYRSCMDELWPLAAYVFTPDD